jgi:AbrB family looped-hinge helix DNA binding protein
MTVAMDKFGRILIPKKLREALHLQPDEPLDLVIENGALRVSATCSEVSLQRVGHILVAETQPLEETNTLDEIRDERLEALARW